MPHMKDPFFGRSVVYISKHNTNGAMGFIINKPFGETDEEFMKSLYIDEDNLLSIVPTVYFGGPVSVERGVILHTSDYTSRETIKISEDFSITSSKNTLRDIHSREGPKEFRLMLGYAGWLGGQLEREIKNGDWLMQSTNIEFIFRTPDELKWEYAAESLGIKTFEISGLGGIA